MHISYHRKRGDTVAGNTLLWCLIVLLGLVGCGGMDASYTTRGIATLPVEASSTSRNRPPNSLPSEPRSPAPTPAYTLPAAATCTAATTPHVPSSTTLRPRQSIQVGTPQGGPSLTFVGPCATSATPARLALAPNGRWVAIAGAREVALYSVLDSQLLWSTEIPSAGLAIAVSPDSTLIAVGLADERVLLLQARDGIQARLLRGPQNGTQGLAFSHDGQLLAGGYTGRVALWRVADGGEAGQFRTATGAVTALAFELGDAYLRGFQLGVPDPHRFTATARYRWRIGDGVADNATDGPPAVIQASNTTGSAFVIQSLADDFALLLWQPLDVLSPTVTIIPPGQAALDREVTALAFSPNGDVVIGGTRTGTVFVWRAADGALLASHSAGTKMIAAVALTPDGTVLVAVTVDGNVTTWHR